MRLTCLLRRTYDAAALLRDHPLRVRDPNKQLVFDRLVTGRHGGRLDVSRWVSAPLDDRIELSPTQVAVAPTVFDYAGPTDGVWHVNFADPHLFFGYGISLLAQDELQALEHPALGAIREALLAEGDGALTEENGHPTPFLVSGVERRGALDTRGLYGPRFAAAEPQQIHAALTVLDPPPVSHLIAIAAPVSAGGLYQLDDYAMIVRTAATGFAAAVAESRRLWPGAPVEIRTGFWGCGAFGGHRHVMVALQLLAARMAGVDRIRFYTVTVENEDDYDAGHALLDELLPAPTLGKLLTRLVARGYRWGVGDGT
jgi:hypothetical protein